MPNAFATPSASPLGPCFLERWDRWLEKNKFLAGAVLIAFTLVVFSGVVANGFVSDDNLQILQNPVVLNPHFEHLIFTNSVWSFRGPGRRVDFYRPLQILSYWCIYRLAGPKPAAFHLIQLLLYCLTVALVWRLGRKLIGTELVAFAGALLWAVNPLNVETVGWIACWPEIGFVVFYLLGFTAFIRAESAPRDQVLRHYFAALVYIPSLFFKEAAVSFPLTVLAYWFFNPPHRSWRELGARFAPYALAVACYLGVRRLALSYVVTIAHPLDVSRLAIAAGLGLLGQHAQLFLWPVNLSFSRTFDLDSSLRSPWPWITLFAALAAIIARNRERKLGFLAAWWGITLLPCLNLHFLSVPLLAERFSYLPSVGLCLAVAYLLIGCPPRLSAKIGGAWQWAEAVRPYVAGAVFSAVLCFWTIQSVRAIPNWHDDDTLAAITLKHSPGSASMHFFRAFQLEYRDGNLDGAASEYRQSMHLNDESLNPQAWITYDAYLGLGRIAQHRQQDSMAVGFYSMATHILPSSGAAYHALGVFYFPRREYATAADYFVKAVQRDPEDLIGRFFLGTCWMKLGRYREAAEEFGAAAAADPTYREAYEAEARALEAAGDSAGAARVRNSLASAK
jgi:hypothetical protein